MKFMTFKNNFFKEKKGKIYFSDEVIIYEIINEKEKIFQTIDFEREIIKKLNLYIKKLNSLSIDIIFDKLYFQKTEIIIEKNEILEEEIEKYIEYSVKEFLEETDISDYFIKYFKKENNKYIIFIFERNFIEELIDFSLENKLKINKIIIKDEEEYILNDYDALFEKEKSTIIDKKNIFLMLIFLLIFFSLKIYNFKIKNNIENINKKILLKDEEINKIKIEHDSLKKEIDIIKEKINENSEKKEYFCEKIFIIFENMPQNITVQNVYFEKEILNIKGISIDEKSLFIFLEFLEKNKKIENVKYDYIIKKENFYEFFLELRLS